jgi:glycosyltransferase involved in cell wall biosynthesis
MEIQSEIYILTFIATPKRQAGIVRDIIEYAIGCKQISKIICYNLDELKLYQQVFPVVASKFAFIPLSEEFPEAEEFEIKDNGYFFAAGRSNRDYEFLIKYFHEHTDKTLYIVADFIDKNLATENIKIFTNTYHAEYFKLLAGCHAVLIAFQDETISSGQMVFLHALQLGKPVIATRSSCLKGYLIDGKNGYEIEKTTDAMENAISSLENAECYALISDKNKIDHRDKFSFESMGRRVYEIIHE